DRDFAAACPRAIRIDYNAECVLAQDFCGYFFIGHGLKDASKHEIDAALPQLSKFLLPRLCCDHMDGDLRVLTRQAIDDLRNEAGRHGFRTSDTNFPDRGIRQELDISNSLHQLIEDDVTALEQRTRVHRRFDTTRAAVDQADTQRALQARNRFGN